MTKRLAGQVALVTGAGSGIGAAIAWRLAEEGAQVALHHHRSEAGAEATAARIREAGGQASVHQADLRSREAAHALVAEAEAALGPLDVVVANAGTVVRVGLEALDQAALDEVLGVNLEGGIWLAQAAMPRLAKRPSASMVFIGSMRGQEGGASSPHYAAAKAGVDALAKSLAKAYAPTVRVNSVAPGYVDTRLQASLSPEARATIEAETPLKRFGTPEEVAGVVAFLASADAGYITGQVLRMDGGRLMA